MSATEVHNLVMIDVDEIHARIGALRALEKHDPEAAAAGAEELRVEALGAIAAGATNARELAIAAHRTIDEDIGGQ